MRVTMAMLEKMDACTKALEFAAESGRRQWDTKEIVPALKKHPHWLGWLMACRPNLTRALLAAGANVNARSAKDGGDTALTWAAGGGRVAVVRALLKANARVNLCDNEGWTALHWAVDWGYPTIVRMLLQHRARTNIRDKEGNTVCDIASEKPWHAHIAAILEAHGVKCK